MADDSTALADVDSIEEGGARVTILKAQEAESRQQSTDAQDRTIYGDGIVPVPYDPGALCALYEGSNSLRQNVDALATNVDGFGHRLELIFDFDAEDAEEKLADELRREGDTASDPAKLMKSLQIEARDEEVELDQFFEYAASDMSFVSLRKITRQDLEVTGNAYWEVIRNLDQSISHFLYVPSFTVRHTPARGSFVEVTEICRSTVLGTKTRKRQKRFRTFVQSIPNQQARSYFREFGDPRTLSSSSGQVYESLEAMKEQEPEADPATEILAFKLHSARATYGVPRWVGNMMSVQGSRAAESVNLMYFENKSIPPMAILVSGGRIAKDSVKRLQDYVENHLKGSKNFHKIMIIEAEPAIGNSIANETSSRMKIELKPLTSAQNSDALFQNYDQFNRDKVGESFRIPRILRGDMRDFNRSTAFAALTFAEQQVFQPDRAEFDFIINRKIMPLLKSRFHRFVSLAPVTRDPVAMSEIVKNLSNANVLTPEEGRELASDIFNKAFRKLKAAWTKQPAAFTLAGYDFSDGDTGRLPGADPASQGPQVSPQGKFGAVGHMAKVLIQLRKLMRSVDNEQAVTSYKAAHDSKNVVIELSRKEMEELFEPTGTPRV